MQGNDKGQDSDWILHEYMAKIVVLQFMTTYGQENVGEEESSYKTDKTKQVLKVLYNGSRMSLVSLRSSVRVPITPTTIIAPIISCKESRMHASSSGIDQ